MDKEYQRLKRLLIIFGVLVILALAFFVTFVTAELRHLKFQISTQPTHTETVIEKPTPAQLPTLAELKGEKGDSIKGDKGDTAQVDYSLVKQYIQEIVDRIPKPKDGRNGDNGVNGREIEMCRLPDSKEYGQRYVGTTICTPIEVVE